MKIKLIEPTRYLANGSLLKSKKLPYPSITFPLLAALTPPDIDISIANELFEDIDFDEKVDLVGITSIVTNIYRAYEIADKFRKRKVPVVMGGCHVFTEPEEALEHADTIIVGEAEETWPQFINDFRNGVSKKIYKPEKRPSLINLPVPRFSLVHKAHYAGYTRKGLYRFLLKPLIPIETARGCFHSCDFCDLTKFFEGTYRPRPVSDVIQEIKALGAKFVCFVDANIFANPPRAKELFQALIPLKIRWLGQATIAAAEDGELITLARKSGCVWLLIGLESISGESLQGVGKEINKVKDYEKNLNIFRKAGIDVHASMIFGFDGEGPSVFEETYNFLVKNCVPYAGFQPIVPYPGTPFYKRLADQKRLKYDKWWLNPDAVAKIYDLKYTGTHPEGEAFAQNLYRYFRLFYSLHSIMRRTLLPPTLRSPLVLFLNLVFRKRVSHQTNIGDH